jgi:hypothetical protein
MHIISLSILKICEKTKMKFTQSDGTSLRTRQAPWRTDSKITKGLCVTIAAVLSLLGTPAAKATEGALGRPVSGLSVTPDAGVVPDGGVTIVNLQQIYLDGSIGGNRQVPIAGQVSMGVDAEVALTLATIVHTWGGAGGWNFGSAFTLPYIWESVHANYAVGPISGSAGDRVSNLYDLYFTPIIAGYKLTPDDNIAFSFNFYAPTGNYNPNALANAGLNTWTFVPQVAYTKTLPKYGIEFDAVMGLQFYTRNSATNYQNAPLFTLDLMGRKILSNGLGVGLVLGTTQQLGNDTGPIADRLGGFKGSDFALGPIVTYSTKLEGKLPVSAGLRWLPTISSTNRLKSSSTVMGSATVAF